jgi:catechol 2,3-dioxygenase-like lactoylglutathione lyase family enzyme
MHRLSQMRFDHIGFIVDDLDAARTFARDVLGLGEPVTTFRADEHGLSGEFFDLESGRLEMFRFDEPGDRLKPGESPHLDHIAVEVDDLDAEMQRLSQHGVQFTGPLDPTPIDTPVELRGKRHVWTKPETSGGMMIQLIGAAAR